MDAFLIATLVYFVFSLGMGIVNLAINAGDPDKAATVVGAVIGILISLGFITWNIVLLVS